MEVPTTTSLPDLYPQIALESQTKRWNSLLSKKPTFRAKDVTVAIRTTFKGPGELVRSQRSIVACSPAKAFIVTAISNVNLVRTCCALNSFYHVRVLGVKKLNRRCQMIEALKEVGTDIVVFADDDVVWPVRYLEHLLAIFENVSVGAGGTRQRVHRSMTPSFWNFLGIAYLERRV